MYGMCTAAPRLSNVNVEFHLYSTYVCMYVRAFFCAADSSERFGKREGFENVTKARCHAVGTTFMRGSAVNIHENVVGYDEAQRVFHSRSGFGIHKFVCV